MRRYASGSAVVVSESWVWKNSGLFVRIPPLPPFFTSTNVCRDFMSVCVHRDLFSQNEAQNTNADNTLLPILWESFLGHSTHPPNGSWLYLGDRCDLFIRSKFSLLHQDHRDHAGIWLVVRTLGPFFASSNFPTAARLFDYPANYCFCHFIPSSTKCISRPGQFSAGGDPHNPPRGISPGRKGVSAGVK